MSYHRITVILLSLFDAGDPSLGDESLEGEQGRKADDVGREGPCELCSIALYGPRSKSEDNAPY